MKNPVIFVTEVVSALVTLLFVRDLLANDGQAAILRPDRRLALVHGAVRQLSPRPSPKGAARRRRTRYGARAATRTPNATSIQSLPDVPVEGVNALDLRVGDVVLRRGGRGHPWRRRHRRGRRLGQRIRDHRQSPRPSFARPAATAPR